MKHGTITLATILIGTLLSYSAFGDSEQPYSTDPAPHQVSYISGGESTAIAAEEIWINTGDGQKIRIAVRDIVDGQVPIYAGDYSPEAKSWHSIVVYPGAANMVRIGVEEHKIPEEE